MAPSSKPMLARSIEHRTGQKIVMDTVETDGILAKCRPQVKSPLFTLLPRELRDLIWAFATAPIEDPDRPFDKNAFYCRPGHTATLKTDYHILLTCRQAWLEAHTLPMLQAEHSFWFYREAPDARTKEWMAALTPLNRKHFGTLHLYAQMFAIESLKSHSDNLRGYFLLSPSRGEEDFQPARFHVTIRHTDWWHWEEDVPLRFEYRWFQAMLDSPDLRRTETLELELETLDYKVTQLSPIVEHIRRMRSEEFDTHIVHGKPTASKFVLNGDPVVSSWTGPTNLDGHDYTPYKNKKELVYHVVTLTWTLRFSEYPNAHIPTLRLAPQVHLNRLPSNEYDFGFDPAQWLNAIDESDGFEVEERRARELDELDNLDGELTLRGRLISGNRSVNRLWDQEQWRSVLDPIKYVMTEDRTGLRRSKMLVWERGLQFESEWQARISEWIRQRQFWLLMKPRHEIYWRERFLEENALLRLQDH